MNQTEQLAYEWLQNQGIAKQDIIFQSKKTPDFLTPVGEYEVKKSQGKKILFSGDQEKLLKTDITFLVYSKNTQRTARYQESRGTIQFNSGKEMEK